MGFLVGSETAEGYVPSLLFRLLRPRTSGNTINGLGETRRRRPTPVYHRFDFLHPWIVEGATFIARKLLINKHRPYFIRTVQMARTGHIPVAAARVDDTAENWTRQIREFALAQPGCDVIGIAALDPLWVFDRDRIDARNVILVGYRMDYDQFAHSLKGRFIDGEIAVFDSYLGSQEAAVAIAYWIRAKGWPAEGIGGPKGSALNILDAAIAAGLGELGKHGSIMNDRLGSCFRLAYVTTDLPLMPDAPVELGVDEFCKSCRLCTSECPANAIDDTKKTVRGVEKWYVDFDKCVPYFNEHHGCGLCLSICPWSRPGVGPKLVQKMLRKKRERAGAAAD